MIASSLLSFGAQAQGAEPRPTVTRADDLIFRYQSQVPLGTEVVFERRSASAGAALLRAGLQARVFHMKDGQTRPEPITIADDCEVHLSVVYPLEPIGIKELHFTTMDHRWINLTNSGDSTKNTTWFLVFEQTGAAREQFRIKRDDAAAYFDTGFAVTVVDDQSIPFDRIEAEYERRRGHAVALYREIDAKDSEVPCYRYRRVTAALDTDLMADGDIESCTSSATGGE